MENEQMQAPQDTSPDEAMANLAFATNLQEQVLKMQNPAQTTPTEGENGAEMPLNGTETPQVKETPVMEENTPETSQYPTEEINAKIEEVKTELKDELKATIKEELKKLLDEEDN